MLEAGIFHFYYTTLKINDFLRFKAARFSMTNYRDAQDRENGINSRQSLYWFSQKPLKRKCMLKVSDTG